MNSHLLILYDSITNSVFEGQVLAPFAKKISPANRGLLISFERTQPKQEIISPISTYKNIDLIMLNQIPFMGSVSLRYAAWQLENMIKEKMVKIVSVTTRGPLAGWIAGHTRSLQNIPTTIQARGLCAAEYAYTHKQHTSWWHQFRTWQYQQIEQWVYHHYAQQTNSTIEAVSSALSDYLIDTFNAPHNKITVAQQDVPPHVPQEQKSLWRAQIRAQLHIATDRYVYVYNGSAKPWQCPQETVQFFAQQFAKNKNSCLLVLTQDKEPFKKLLVQSAIPPAAYHITHVSYEQIYRYLAAADAGIIFREKDPINWVSRPTKILEYQAVGLKIIHNNTVGILSNL